MAFCSGSTILAESLSDIRARWRPRRRDPLVTRRKFTIFASSIRRRAAIRTRREMGRRREGGKAGNYRGGWQLPRSESWCDRFCSRSSRCCRSATSWRCVQVAVTAAWTTSRPRAALVGFGRAAGARVAGCPCARTGLKNFVAASKAVKEALAIWIGPATAGAVRDAGGDGRLGP